MGSRLDLTQFRRECDEFPGQFACLQLATISAAGEPEASYAPFYSANGKYYIFVSDLAAHTENLRQHANCCLMFIEDETTAAHVFGRKRLTLKSKARVCERDSPLFDQILSGFEAKFGHFIEVMRQLKDFHLFEITPIKGAYVAGFAKAFVLEGEGLCEFRHRNDVGHQTSSADSRRAMDELQHQPRQQGGRHDPS